MEKDLMGRPYESMLASGLQFWASPACLFAALLLFVFGHAGLGAIEGPIKDVRVLEPGMSMQRVIAGDETHYYEIKLAAGQYVHIVVDQQGSDVELVLFGPDGSKVVEMDSPNGSSGTEEVSFVSPSDARYVLEIHPLERTYSGRYVVRTDIRNPTPEDRNRVAAQKAYIDGEALRIDGTAESRRRAIEKYDKALSLYRALGDRHAESLLLHAIGDIFVSLGEVRKALECFEKGLAILEALGNQGELSTVVNSIGTCHHQLGDEHRALEYHLRALRLNRAAGDRWGEANSLNNVGVEYLYVAQYQKAFEYLSQSVGIRRSPISLSNLGRVHTLLGDNQKAIEVLNESLLLARSTADRRAELLALDRMGTAHEALGDREKALDSYAQALSIERLTGRRLWESETLAHIGGVYAAFGERQKALDYYRLALATEREIGDRGREAQTLYSIARVERDRGNLIEARKQIELALEIFDSLRSNLGGQELRASFFASAKGTYDLYVDVLMRLHQREPAQRFAAEAFKASENGRARSLLDMLAEAHADIQQGVDPKLVESERSLRELISSKVELQVRMLGGKHTEQQVKSSAKEIDSLSAEYEHVGAQIRSVSPRYAALTQPKALDLSEIQKLILDRDTALLEYVQGDERSYMWLVTSGSIASFELPKRAVVESAAKRVYELLAARNSHVKFESVGDKRTRIARADSEYLKAALALSQTLLGPVAGELGSKRLLIVADGALQYVPFAALPSPTSLGGYVALGAEHEVASLPSASVLAVLRREIAGRAPPPKTLAVLADPVFEKDDERLKGAGGDTKESGRAKPPPDSPLVRSAQDLGLEEGGRLRIPRLPFTRREAEAIFSLAPAAKRKEVLDFDANLAAAASEDLGQYRFVHFATHGFLNSIHPELSGLVLSLVDRSGNDQDGFLTALDIYNLKLPVDLVVLSGCRTGLGKDIRGEGLIGLTRGFMYAGAARVLVSLWDVDDEATAELMTRFYDGMLGKRHLSPAAALRAAQLSISKEKRWQAPYYWAAFILQGEPK